MRSDPPTGATPALVVDADVLEQNLQTMARHAAETGVALRPHAKTHKCLELARLQLEHGATGLTVATVGEAEIFSAAGIQDLFIAYPVWVDRGRARRIARLLSAGPLTVGIDSAEGARALAAQLGSDAAGLRVLVEVDSGHHRTGVAPSQAGALADVARHAGLDVRGVFTFPGHGYAPDRPGQASSEEATALRDAAAGLERVGIDPQIRSGGSTPTARCAAGGVLTELRPGVYVFNDAQQLELGTCGPEAVALTAVATVVSRRGDTVVLDAGSKLLGADRAPWATGFGRLLDHPEARVVALSEHHATVAWDHSPLPTVGDWVRVVPNHVCSAVNLADELVVVRDGAVLDRWPVAARGANT
jgi:D-serine deaminase-like pyridoxal phosphate-dependent protein